MADALKDLFDAGRYRQTAAQLAALHPRFDSVRFLTHALDGLSDRELLARLHRTAEAFHLALPVPFAEQLVVLRTHAPQIGHGFVAIWPCAHVTTHGINDPATALDALKFFTRFGSAEFAIRPFIILAPEATIAVMRRWASDADEHVRRLASEGSRPRLPWGGNLPALIADPSPTLPILTALRADPSLYVRKSVANHLNDITKNHPELVLDFVTNWDRTDARTAWIVRHALRTLIKRGHPKALALMGAGATPKLDAHFKVGPARLKLGGTLTLTASLVSTHARTQSLIVDYVLHYARPGGASAEKVFKWKQLTLAAGESVTLSKRQVIRDFSTRRHHPGRHRVELQINGRRLAAGEFSLSG
ncbi:MAG: DNA alkylation repair protein [Opitutus sp.]|nr:DNA alkylation repair protein [Opitutus sp.]MCS6246321.1 DNA alkylation repair protein [Opitutus sp.]MCS6273053.1 DNA alkylation repair protein [Opitutus sp.]MCS6277882.1 DNA alkylation repair protein [Opitutus sp.]MCS6299011.1 DNA alkylation repair protein [Opitutus sp.]